MAARGDFDWTDAVVARLKALWASGLSTAKIGLDLGVTKSAIVGKAHRLHLTPRGSPIRPMPETGPTPRKNRVKAAKITLTPLADQVEQPKPEPVLAPASPPTPPYVPTPRIVACNYPTSNARPWRFCGEDSLPGKPMCATHCKLCYAGKKPPRVEPVSTPKRSVLLARTDWI